LLLLRRTLVLLIRYSAGLQIRRAKVSKIGRKRSNRGNLLEMTDRTADQLLQAAFQLLQIKEFVLCPELFYINAESPATAGDSDYNNRLERKD